MKPLLTSLWCAIALLIVAPLALFLEIKFAGHEAVAQVLPLMGITLAMWLSAVAEAYAARTFEKSKAQLQLKLMMSCKALRFLLAVLLLIAFGILSQADIRLIAVNLMICYIAVTIALAISYTKRSANTKVHTEPSEK
ncbi:MAG: hypothetical protein IJ786_03100 [Bacteroidaceae bacterium]|nr:hypothetical protein [Bacteroidaceae bacterium]